MKKIIDDKKYASEKEVLDETKKEIDERSSSHGKNTDASLVNLTLLSPEKMHNIAIISTVVSIPYLITGLIQIIFYLLGKDIIPGDPIAGFVLVLIGIIFLYGAMDFMENIQEGIAFYYMGIILSFIFFILFVLILIADWMEFLLGNEDFSGWSPQDDMVPGIYLVIFPLIFYIYLRKSGILRLGHTFMRWEL